MSLKNHILVVDDDERIRSLLARFLVREGYYVSVAHNAAEASHLLSKIQFDLIVLDVMMPGEDGFSFCARLRDEGIFIPVILLTAKGEVVDRIKGLEQGADDYLPKPFEPKELVLRIDSILRRVQQKKEQLKIIRFGDYRFDQERGCLVNGQEIVDLTSVEARLLVVLSSKPGEIFDRYLLAEETGQDPSSRTIDVQITRLRKKVEPDPQAPRYIQTIRGQGYILRPDYE